MKAATTEQTHAGDDRWAHAGRGIPGRRVLTREVGSLGPGRHAVKLGSTRAVPAGIYWVRLAQNGRALTARAAIVH